MCKIDKNIKMKDLERKTVLKNTIGRKLPKQLLKAPKKGFTVLLYEWFADNKFQEQLNRLLKMNYNFDKTIISDIITENNRGIKDNGNILWMFFVLNKISEDAE